MESSAGTSTNSFSTDRSERGDRPGRRPATNRPAILSPTGTGSSPTNSGTRPPTSPSPGVSPTGGQSQHEVLQNFFNSLLAKDRPGSTGTRPKSNGVGIGSKGDKSAEEEESS